MLTCIVACTFAQSVVGKWKATPETIKAMNLEQGQCNIYFTFNANKNYNILFDYLLEKEVEGIALKLTIKANIPGNYKTQGDVLTINPNTQKVTSSIDLAFPGLDKETAAILKEAMGPTVQEQKDELVSLILQSFGDTMEGNYSISGKILNLDGMTLSRVK